MLLIHLLQEESLKEPKNGMLRVCMLCAGVVDFGAGWFDLNWAFEAAEGLQRARQVAGHVQRVLVRPLFCSQVLVSMSQLRKL